MALWPSMGPLKPDDEARGLLFAAAAATPAALPPSKPAGGPMLLDIELRPMSEGVSAVSSCLPLLLLAVLGFLLSASRGSSWHKWPMLRLMHLVHGLACSQGQLSPR